MNQDWDIKPRSKACQLCSSTFVDRQPYFTALRFAAEGYTRTDCCEACWAKPESKAAGHSSWKGVFRLPPAEPERTVKKEAAESLLRGLLQKEEGTHRNAIYILAVMLERQRLFVEREVKVRDDGVRVRVYEHRKTGEVFLIPDPQLRLGQLEEVQKEVMALLAGSETQPATPEPPGEGIEAAPGVEPQPQTEE